MLATAAGTAVLAMAVAAITAAFNDALPVCSAAADGVVEGYSGYPAYPTPDEYTPPYDGAANCGTLPTILPYEGVTCW